MPTEQEGLNEHFAEVRVVPAEEVAEAKSRALDDFLRLAVARGLNGRLNPDDVRRWYR